MNAPDLILSLFPGIGLLDRAFEECGFCVVRGPDILWGGDIRQFHPPTGVFWGVIGGPLMLICQDSFNQLYPYLVASHLVQGRQTIAITSHPQKYASFWASTLNHWGVVDWIIYTRQRLGQQLPLMGTGDNSTKTHEWGQDLRSQYRFPELSPFPIGVSA